ncbi:MAG: transporter substrate-binding domain-containing protein [Caldilineaceae bacterium]
MKRHKWLWLALAVGLATTLLVWLLWSGGASPLSSLLPAMLRRDTTWQAMQVRKTWRVGMDPSFPPFESLDAAGAPQGYDVDLARKLAAGWGMEAEIVSIGFDSLIDALQAAKVDAIASAYPYDARLTRDVAFSQPYFDSGLRLVVPVGAAIRSSADLNGKRVGVEWGSEGDMVGRQWQRDGIDLTLVPYETPQDAVAALAEDPTESNRENQAVDAILIDGVTLRQAQAAGAALSAAGAPVTGNPYVIVVPRRAPDLLQQVNAGLERLRANGELDMLGQEWFGQP